MAEFGHYFTFGSKSEEPVRRVHYCVSNLSDVRQIREPSASSRQLLKMSVDDFAWELNVVWFDAAKQNGDASSSSRYARLR